MIKKNVINCWFRASRPIVGRVKVRTQYLPRIPKEISGFFYFREMHFVNIIYSKIRDRYYVGSTSNISLRLEKHNTNHSGFTGNTGDWVLKFQENYPTKTEAFNSREKN